MHEKSGLTLDTGKDGIGDELDNGAIYLVAHSPIQKTIAKCVDALEPVPPELWQLAFDESERIRSRWLERTRIKLLALREEYAATARMLLYPGQQDGQGK